MNGTKVLFQENIHKSRIITLINNDEIFDASQQFLYLAYENGSKRFLQKSWMNSRRITENLGK